MVKCVLRYVQGNGQNGQWGLKERINGVIARRKHSGKEHPRGRQEQELILVTGHWINKG